MAVGGKGFFVKPAALADVRPPRIGFYSLFFSDGIAMSMETTESIHGHEVIELIVTTEPAISRAALAREVSRRFGPEARFHTCSAEGLTLDGLLAFLMARGKIAETGGVLTRPCSNCCGGDHDHHDPSHPDHD